MLRVISSERLCSSVFCSDSFCMSVNIVYPCVRVRVYVYILARNLPYVNMCAKTKELKRNFEVPFRSLLLFFFFRYDFFCCCRTHYYYYRHYFIQLTVQVGWCLCQPGCYERKSTDTLPLSPPPRVSTPLGGGRTSTRTQHPVPTHVFRGVEEEEFNRVKIKRHPFCFVRDTAPRFQVPELVD